MTLLMSLVGMVTLVTIALIFSYDRKSIRLRTVLGAFGIQAGIGAFVLYVPFGQTVLQTISAGVSQILVYADDGISFLFGGLADADEVGFVFAIKVLPVIIFFSSLIAVLPRHHAPILRGARTSRTESLSATANIFVGQTEAPLVVRPFIARMTPSQLFAVMCGGLASVAGSVLAGRSGYPHGIPGRSLLHGGPRRLAVC